jgi:hypothetical protein
VTLTAALADVSRGAQPLAPEAMEGCRDSLAALALDFGVLERVYEQAHAAMEESQLNAFLEAPL